MILGPSAHSTTKKKRLFQVRGAWTSLALAGWVAMGSAAFAQTSPTSAPATAGGNTAIIPATPVTTTVDPAAIQMPDSSIKPSTVTTPGATTGAIASSEAGWVRITGTSVNVRARADVNSPAVTRLERDAVVRAVRRENGWYAIQPPEDVFSLVAAQFIERVGADRGIVKVAPGSSLRVRTGSRTSGVDPQIMDVQAKLSNGAEVRIVGEMTDTHNDRWLQIVPPDGVLTYVSAEYAESISDDAARARGANLGAGNGRTAVTTPGTTALVGTAQNETSSLTPTAADKTTTTIIPVTPAGDTTSGQATTTGETTTTETTPIAGGDGKVITTTTIIPVTPAPNTPGYASTLAGHGQGTVVTEPTVTTYTPTPTTIEPAAGVTTAGDVSVTTIPPTVITTAAPESTGSTQLIGPFPSAQAGNPENPGFDVEGILQPSWRIPAGTFGLRYKLCNPTNPNLVRGYVEFPFDLRLTPTQYIGKYVGIVGDRYMDTEHEVPIHRAKRLTVLSPERAVNRPRE